MRHISKSYIKLFIKSWVETLGTILFLMIFTMIIIGMLATPLQLSIRASGVKRETNIWDRQMQSNFQLNENFVYDILYKGGEYATTYGQITPEIEGGWLSDEAIEVIELWAENQYQSSTNINAENKDEYIKSLIIQQIRTLVRFARNNGPENEITYVFNLDPLHQESPIETLIEISDDGLYQLSVKNFFKAEVQDWFRIENTWNNVNSFIANRTLRLIAENEPDFRYNTFNKIQSIMMINNQSMNFVIESGLSTKQSDNDADLNNLLVREGPESLAVVTPDSFASNTSNPIEGYVNDLFLKSQNLQIGDILTVPFPVGPVGENVNIRIKIVGVAEKYSTLTSFNTNFLQSMDNFAQIFVDPSFFDYENFFETLLPNNFIFDFQGSFNFQERYIQNSKYEINRWFTPSSLNGGIGIHESGRSMFTGVSEHSRISQITNLTIMTWVFSVIGGILFILAFFFITFVLKKEINNTRKQLGVFKSIGYKTWELTWVFALKTFITMFVSISVGYLLSIPFQIQAATETYSGMVTFVFQVIYHNPIFLLVILLLIPLLFSIFAYGVIFKFLNEGALSLLTTGPKQKRRVWFIYAFYVAFPFVLIFVLINKILMKIFKDKNICFTYRMQDTFVKLGRGKYFIVMLLIGFTSFLFTIQLRAVPILNSVIAGIFNINNPNLNHIFNFDDVSKLEYRDGVRINPSIIYSDMNYVDYSSWDSLQEYLENDGQEKFTNYEDIHNLITKIGELRSSIIPLLPSLSNGIDEEMLPIMFNMLALFYPLDEIEDLDFNNLWELIGNISKLKDWMESENNIYNLKNDTSPKSGIWLNDIARYMCISTQGIEFRNCNDVVAFQDFLLNQNQVAPTGNLNIQNNLQTTNLMNSIFSSWISEFLIRDLSTDQFIATNTVLYNKQTDLLVNNISYYIQDNVDVNLDSSNIIMFDTKGRYGNPRNGYNLTDITDLQIANLRNKGTDLPVFISGRLARILNAEIGHKFNIQVGRQRTFSENVVVTGIIETDNMTQSIYMDYNNFMDRNGVDLNPDLMYFTSIMSQAKSFTGEVNLSELQNLATMFQSHVRSSTLMTSVGPEATNWLGPILDIYFRNLDDLGIAENLPEEYNEILNFMVEEILQPIDSSISYQLAANPLSSGLRVIPMLRSLADQLMGYIEDAMTMYMAIDVILMVILLVVIMNIIINDSINVIMIMRSLGYTNRRINWMVMGRYLTGATIVFIFSYLFSMVLWEVLKLILWQRLKVLLVIPTLPWIPIVSFVAIGFIMFCGWLAAMYQIKNKPLTYLID